MTSTDNDIKFHFQMVRLRDKDEVQITVHEAFSLVSGGLYMVNNVPIIITGETPDDIKELVETIDSDLEKYGIVDYEDIQAELERFDDYNPGNTDIDFDADFNFDENGEEATILPEFPDGKVLDLVDFMNKRK